MYTAYTDGACAVHSSGCGAFAVVMLGNNGVVVDRVAVHECNTTSQRMELQGIIEALDMVAPDAAIQVFTDSQYVVNGYSGAWKLRQNLDLWYTLQQLSKARQVSITWIPRNSHLCHKDADGLANKESKLCPSLAS